MQISKWVVGFMIPVAMSGPAWGQDSGVVSGEIDTGPETVKLVDVTQIQSGGTGCKGGEALEVYQSQYSGRIMVFFPEMNVDVTQKGLDRKACALSLPISLPADKRLVIGQPAVFGSTALAEGASAIASLEIFEAGSQGPKIEKVLEDSADLNDFYYDRSSDEVRTACGAQINLRANLSLLAKKGSSVGGTAMIEGAAMTFQIEDCEVDDGASISLDEG